MEQLKTATGQLPSINVTENIGNVAETATTAANTAVESVKQSLSGFSSQSVVNAGSDFLTSNSIIAKVVFLILVIVGFFILSSIGIALIAYFSQAAKDTYVIHGKIGGTANVTVPQDPKDPNSVPILRSNNAKSGIEYTWSVWFNADGAQGDASGIIFRKGNAKTESVNASVNSPGVYFSKDGTLTVVIDLITSKTPVVISVTDIPIKKWVHVAIRLTNTVCDVYVNGNISARRTLPEAPLQNYEPVTAGIKFSGQISNLKYYSRGLSAFQIKNLVMAGPSLVDSSVLNQQKGLGTYDYLAGQWYVKKY